MLTLRLKRGVRGVAYDADVKAIMADVADVISDGQTIRDQVDALNEAGVPAPSGGRWSYSSLRRFLRRVSVYGFAVRCRKPAEAIRTRRRAPYVYYPNRPPRPSWAGRRSGSVTTSGELEP